MRPSLLTFLVCLALGLAVVGWRMKVRVDAAGAHARTEAQARGAALEVQFSQVVSAAEVLGAVARQSGGPVPNFQKVAADLLATRPGLAYLELQPGGVVGDIVPRAGYERAIGFNVLNDPIYRAGAQMAIQKRALTVSVPVRLYRGEPGIIVRVPILQRGRDGRDYFWGFVAASMRLSEALARARLEELSAKGYDYLLYLPAPARQEATRVAARGSVSLQDAVQEPVRAQEVEFRLALQPQGGWVNKTKVLLEFLGVLFVSGLLWLLVRTLEGGREKETQIDEANRGLARETEERKRAESDFVRAKEGFTATQTQLKETQFALQQAGSKTAELEARLEATLRSGNEASEVAQRKLQQAELKAQEVQSRFDAAIRATGEVAKSKQAELEQAQAALKQAQQTIADLQVRVETTARAAKEAAAVAQSRAQQDQATIADLKTRSDVIKRQAQEAEAAAMAKLKEAEENNQELTARLIVAEQETAKAAELAALLQETQAELENHRVAATATTNTPAPESANVEPLPTESTDDEVVAIIAAESNSTTATTVTPDGENPVAFEQENPDGISSESDIVRLSELPTSETVPSPIESREPDAVVSPADKEAEAQVITLPPEPAPKPKPATRRKKAARDVQMDLFGARQAESDLSKPAANAPAKEPLMLESEPASLETAPEQAEETVEEASEQAGDVIEVADDEASVNAEESPAPAPEGLPVIDGLDTNQGLEWSEGDTEAYLKALRHFAEQEANLPEKIRNTLLQGDAAEAERLLRGLKTAANDVGATAVLNAAAEMARVIHEKDDPDTTESLWTDLDKAVRNLVADLRSALKLKEEKPPARRLPPPPPLNPALLRKAVSQILPLLVDGDPGSKDCLKDNRSTFRSAFTPEGYLEFEQLVKSRDYSAALELLKKAAKKQGIPV